MSAPGPANPGAESDPVSPEQRMNRIRATLATAQATPATHASPWQRCYDRDVRFLLDQNDDPHALLAAQGAPAAPDSSLPTVLPGQVWADNDPRESGRTLRVDTTDTTHAVCTVLTDRTQQRPGQPSAGKTTRIALRRFRPTSTGYRLTQPETPLAATVHRWKPIAEQDPISALQSTLMLEWARVDGTSDVAQSPDPSIETFRDMAKAALTHLGIEWHEVNRIAIDS